MQVQNVRLGADELADGLLGRSLQGLGQQIPKARSFLQAQEPLPVQQVESVSASQSLLACPMQLEGFLLVGCPSHGMWFCCMDTTCRAHVEVSQQHEGCILPSDLLRRPSGGVGLCCHHSTHAIPHHVQARLADLEEDFFVPEMFTS